MATKIKWFLFAFLSIGISLYPFYYLTANGVVGLLTTKSETLLADTLWKIGFNTHISLGGIALLIGWTQFSKKLRQKNISLHRNIGKVYIISVLLSSMAAFFIGYYATGGIISSIGFMSLAVIWFYTTFRSFQLIKVGDVSGHQRMMIFSYAAGWAAVTLRIYLPFLIMMFKGDFIPAYQIVAYLCWIPNMIFAYWYVEKNGVKTSKYS